jgi:hypothetical protein
VNPVRVFGARPRRHFDRHDDCRTSSSTARSCSSDRWTPTFADHGVSVPEAPLALSASDTGVLELQLFLQQR